MPRPRTSFEAALGIQPQHVVVVARKQQSSCVGLHPRVAFAARGRNSGSAVVRRLDLAPPNLHATMCEVALVCCESLVAAIAKSPMAKGYQELGQRRYGRALSQHHGLVISDEALHMLPLCQLTRGHGCMDLNSALLWTSGVKEKILLPQWGRLTWAQIRPSPPVPQVSECPPY